MENLIKLALFVHIVSGFTALVMGLLALIANKGGKTHKRSGNIFFYCMIMVALSGFIVAYYRNNYFLLMIAIFAFAQTYFGYRAIKNKAMRATIADWFFMVLFITNSVFMIVSLNVVLLVFGGLSLLLSARQSWIFYKAWRQIEMPKNIWLKQHISMMMGSLIATITAFALVNLSEVQPAWLPWLAPTGILVPLIFYFQRKYAANPKKLARI